MTLPQVRGNAQPGRNARPALGLTTRVAGFPASALPTAPSAGQGERRLARVSRGGSRTGFPPQQVRRIESP